MMEAMSEDRSNLGPHMAALPNDQQRAFVRHWVATGGSNGTLSAQTVGYSPTNARAAGVTAHRLLRDPKVCAAIREVSEGFLAGELPRFMAALRAVALDHGHRDQIKALIWIHATLGISPITKAELTVTQETTVSFDRDKALAELQRMEREMGIKLLPQPPEPEDEQPDDGPHILARPERNFRKRPQRAA